ncbi:MAG: hypothetical protein WDN26_20765 [Chitinophagaceae bacterium]
MCIDNNARISAFIMAQSQWPAEVKIVTGKSNDSVIVRGDLASGRIIDDLSWASNSSNACFVALQNAKFRGNHVFFATLIPPHSIMYISVKPQDEQADLSMYAYMSVMSEHYLVPDLPKCITCEADYKWDRPWKNRVQTSQRKVEFNNPTNGHLIFLSA